MAFDLTAAAAIVKEYYDDLRVEDLTQRNHPFLALVPKMENWTGDTYPIPVLYGHAQNISATASKAFAGSDAPEMKAFDLKRVRGYNRALLDMETLEATSDQKGAFASSFKISMDGALVGLGNDVSNKLFRKKSGSIGKVKTVSAGVITLTEADDAQYFWVGMKIEADDQDGGGTVHSGVGTVTAVDRKAGTVTYSGTITGIAANDFLFREGDYDKSISGLISWIPNTAPTSGDDHFGVDRSVDVTALAGSRIDPAAGTPIEETLIDAMLEVELNGGKVSHIFIHPRKWYSLAKSMASRTYFVDVKAGAEANISFRGFMVAGSHSEAVVLADSSCQPNKGYALQLDTWEFKSLKKVPRLDTPDGLELARVASADQVEARFKWYGNLGCHAPGYNCIINFA